MVEMHERALEAETRSKATLRSRSRNGSEMSTGNIRMTRQLIILEDGVCDTHLVLLSNKFKARRQVRQSRT